MTTHAKSKELLERTSRDLAPTRIDELLYDLKPIAAFHEDIPCISWLPVREEEFLGRVTVDIRPGTTLTISDLLDFNWTRQNGNRISQIRAASDVSHNNRPPLSITDSLDGGNTLRGLSPSHPDAKGLIKDFLDDVTLVEAAVEACWVSDGTKMSSANRLSAAGFLALSGSKTYLASGASDVIPTDA